MSLNRTIPPSICINKVEVSINTWGFFINAGQQEINIVSRFTNSFSEETWYQKYKFSNDNSVECTWKRTADDLASVEKDITVRKNVKKIFMIF